MVLAVGLEFRHEPFFVQRLVDMFWVRGFDVCGFTA